MFSGPRTETAKQRPGRGGLIEYRMFRESNFCEESEERDTGSRRGGAANKHAIDAQRAPVHSSSCGALLRLNEAICDLGRFYVRANIHLAFAGAIARWHQIIGGDVSAAFLGFRTTVTPRLSGSVTLSRWNHRFSISVESMSCRKRAPSASDRL